MTKLTARLSGIFTENISVRYLAISCSFVMVVQLIFGSWQIRNNYVQKRKELHQKAFQQATFISDVAPEAIYNLNFLYLETLVKQATEDKDIVYSVILDRQGNPLTRHLRAQDAMVTEVMQQLPQNPPILTSIQALNQNPDLKMISVPIAALNRPLGEVQLGFSVKALKRENFKAAQDIIIRSLVISLLLALLTIILFQYLVHRPLSDLRKFAVGIERGYLDQRIQVRQPDDFGQVGRALNQMADQLQQTLREIAEARDVAIAANKAKSEFLANMSHELRTPLNAILGFSELLTREAGIPDEHKQTLNIINNSGSHLLSLINDVLEMAKIESGRTSIETKPFDLHQLLDSIYDLLSVRAQAQNLHFVRDDAVDLPQYIQGDDNKLRQILLNLLGNAIKFTQEGSVILAVVAQKLSSPPDQAWPRYHLTFVVEDTGPGISETELKSIFEPFTQSRTGRTSNQGTGLGLSISSRYVELMGGCMDVNSEVDVGTQFKFTIPVQEVDPESIKRIQKTQRRVKGLAPGQPEYRILIVEDVPENLQLLARILELAGFEVRLANNGMECLEIWKEWAPDLIWMDMRMPVMDGFEATRCIRDLQKHDVVTERNRTTIVLALTAFAFEDHRQMALEAGCDDYIRKPFREQEVFDKMHQYLGVEYLYEGDDLLDAEPEEPVTLASIDDREVKRQLSLLPGAWLHQMQDASDELDLDQVSVLINEIAAEHPQLAERLNEWCQQFRFDKITENMSQLMPK